MEAKVHQTWQELVNIPTEGIKSYHDFHAFDVGDIINHNDYGLGHIQASFGNQIEVLFEDKMRTLTHLLLL